MSNISYTYTLTDGTTASAAQVQTNFDDAKAVVNGGLDATNLDAATATLLGLTRGATTSRGKSIIATSEACLSGTYATLATPDQVTVTLPADGLIFVAFQARWSGSSSNNGSADIFIGGTQLVSSYGGSTTPVSQPATSPSSGDFAPLSSWAGGLAQGSMVVSLGGFATTGQAVCTTGGSGVGGPCCIFAAAGTYVVSVKFKVTTGSLNVANRKLWVWTMGF